MIVDRHRTVSKSNIRTLAILPYPTDCDRALYFLYPKPGLLCRNLNILDEGKGTVILVAHQQGHIKHAPVPSFRQGLRPSPNAGVEVAEASLFRTRTPNYPAISMFFILTSQISLNSVSGAMYLREFTLKI